MRRRQTLFVPALVLGVLAAASPASGQQPEEEPRGRAYRGLFGSSNPAAPERFEATMSVFGAYDDNLLAGNDVDGVVDPRVQVGGTYSGFNGALEYEKRTSATEFRFRADTGLRHYREPGDFLGVHEQLAADLTRRLTRRFDLGVSQTVSYSPAFLRGALPGSPELAAVDPSFGAIDGSVDRRESYLTYDTIATLRYRRSSRTTLEAEYGHRYADFQDADGDLRHQTVGARLDHRLKPRLRVGLRYLHDLAEFGLEEGQTQDGAHNALATVQYDQRLGATRLVQLDAGVGVTQVDGFNRLLATAGAAYPFGESWEARVEAGREVHYVDGLVDPYLETDASASLDGYLHPRLSVHAHAGYSIGNVGVSGASPAFDTASAGGSAQFGLSRFLAIDAQYLYYRYDFEAGAVVFVPGGRALGRHGVQVGLTIWLPFVE
jgi:hypothetical protein